jgi:hypothetical protein
VALSASALAQSPANVAQPEISCEQIRSEIAAHVGIPAKPNTELLRKLSGRTECKFTAQEAYRAGFGDKPLPVSEQSSEHDHHHDDDD